MTYFHIAKRHGHFPALFLRWLTGRILHYQQLFLKVHAVFFETSWTLYLHNFPLTCQPVPLVCFGNSASPLSGFLSISIFSRLNPGLFSSHSALSSLEISPSPALNTTMKPVRFRVRPLALTSFLSFLSFLTLQIFNVFSSFGHLKDNSQNQPVQSSIHLSFQSSPSSCFQS